MATKASCSSMARQSYALELKVVIVFAAWYMLSYRKVVWFLYGFGKVLVWFLYGFGKVLVWVCYGFRMVLVWF